MRFPSRGSPSPVRQEPLSDPHPSSAQGRRLLYFDHWTIGIHNFARLHEKLGAAGIDACLLHAGSWREPGAPPVERIGGIDAYDISCLDTRLVYRALDRLRPDAVLMLNSRLMIERATVMACRKLGIRTIYLQHGVLPDLEQFATIVAMQDPVYRHSVGKRASRYLRYYLPNYLYSGSRLDLQFVLRRSLYEYLYGLVSQPTRYLFRPPPSAESRCDRALVYSNLDREIHTEVFGYDPSAIRVVGNPNLDDALTTRYSGRADLLRHHELDDRPYVLYLEEGFTSNDFSGWTTESLNRHLAEMADCCRQAGLHLIVKLHPQTAQRARPDTYSFLRDATVLTDASVSELARYSDKCVGHISTALKVPILQDKPVLVPRWGISAALPKLFGPEVVSFCETPEDLVRSLQRQQFSYDRRRYTDHELTLADGHATARIVHEIDDAMR